MRVIVVSQVPNHRRGAAVAEAFPTVVEARDDIPEKTRGLSPIAEPDYVDLFSVTTGAATETSPERWARVALEGASPAARFVVWQVLCGLRLEKHPSPEFVAGWRMAERGDSWIRLEATSWFMTAHAVVEVDVDRLSVALLVRYDHPAGAVIWPLLSIGHRQAMPGLLRHAVRRMNRSR